MSAWTTWYPNPGVSGDTMFKLAKRKEGKDKYLAQTWWREQGHSWKSKEGACRLDICL